MNFKSLKKQISNIVIIMGLFAIFSGASAYAGSYNYISSSDLKKNIDSKDKVFILDIQVKEEFDMHHIKGAFATYAYPVKSDADKAKLVEVTAKVKSSDDKVVIICPRGKGGAKRTYNHLKSKGVDEGRLFILTEGQSGWPYKEMLSK